MNDEQVQAASSAYAAAYSAAWGECDATEDSAHLAGIRAVIAHVDQAPTEKEKRVSYYQAQISTDGGPWVDQGQAMKHRWMVEANVDGYREQAQAAGIADRYDFRIVEVDAPWAAKPGASGEPPF